MTIADQRVTTADQRGAPAQASLQRRKGEGEFAAPGDAADVRRRGRVQRP